jgi:hypothetical protein
MSERLIIKKRRNTRHAGKGYRFRLSQRANKPKEAVVAYLRSPGRILINEKISEGENDRFYTWLLKEPDLLVAARTRTGQELGTLHDNLDAFTMPGHVIAAGEFYKQDHHLVFNLQSGSFMKSVFGKRKPRSQKLATRDQIIAHMTATFATIGMTSVFAYSDNPEEEYSGRPMIDSADIETTESELRELMQRMSYSETDG